MEGQALVSSVGSPPSARRVGGRREEVSPMSPDLVLLVVILALLVRLTRV